MPNTKNAFDATKQVILKLCVQQARLTEKLVVAQQWYLRQSSLDRETGSGTAVVPQTKLS